MPAFNPWRLLDDPELQAAFRKYSTSHKRIYLMAHFDHPRELTDAAVEGIDCFIRNGVICVNQCPLIKGVNDDAEVLATMFRKLSYIGCPPYYRTCRRSLCSLRCRVKHIPWAKDGLRTGKANQAISNSPTRNTGNGIGLACGRETRSLVMHPYKRASQASVRFLARQATS